MISVFDLVIIVILAWAAITGFIKGLIIQLVSLIALFLGLIGAAYYLKPFAAWLSSFVHLSGQSAQIVSFIILFLIIVTTIILVGRLLDKIVDHVSLGIMNKLAGMLFAVFKAILLISVLINFINIINVSLI